MGKMAELHAQKELIDQLENGVCKNIDEVHRLKKTIKYLRENCIVIKTHYSDDEETGARNYDFENMQKTFDKKMKELEVDAEMRQEAWNEKQQDYAMDNMTCDEIDEERDDV